MQKYTKKAKRQKIFCRLTYLKFNSTDNYFTRPYHSWEKGSVKNANGLLRQYFRKCSSFVPLSQVDVQRACDLINNRPRKRFGFLSPYEMFCMYFHWQLSQPITPLVLRL